MSTSPKLDLPTLQDRCKRLQDLLQRYSATEPDAALCLRELKPIFDQAMAGQISEPRKYGAPCGYYFTEGSLRQYRELENAFAQFSMALQGYSDEYLEALIAKVRR